VTIPVAFIQIQTLALEYVKICMGIFTDVKPIREGFNPLVKNSIHSCSFSSKRLTEAESY